MLVIPPSHFLGAWVGIEPSVALHASTTSSRCHGQCRPKVPRQTGAHNLRTRRTIPRMLGIDNALQGHPFGRRCLCHQGGAHPRTPGYVNKLVRMMVWLWLLLWLFLIVVLLQDPYIYQNDAKGMFSGHLGRLLDSFRVHVTRWCRTTTTKSPSSAVPQRTTRVTAAAIAGCGRCCQSSKR